MITDFPFTNEIIDIIKNLTPYVVKGNREEYLLNYEKTKDSKIWQTLQHSGICCYYNHLRADNIDYIRSLPEQLVLEFEGVTIKAVHASPDSITELVYFNTPRMEEIFNNLEEQVLVFGHTHRLASFETKNNKTIVQAGALGMHNNELGKAQYTILTCEQGHVKVEPRTLDYDINILKNRIRENGGVYKEARTWENLCYCTIAMGKDIRQEFCKEAKYEMIQKYNGKLPEGINKSFNSFDDDIYIKVADKFKKYIVL